MNKQDLIATIKSSHGTTATEAKKILSTILDRIDDALGAGDVVRIAGFGAFKMVETKARTCRNPATGGTVAVPAGHRIKFKASSTRKE